MKYREVLLEQQALAILDGIKDNESRKVLQIHKYSAAVRLDLVRRTRKVNRHVEDYQKAHDAIVQQHGVANKKIEECSKEALDAVQKDLNDLAEKECGLPEKKWKPDQLNLKENQIPIEVLAFLLEDDHEDEVAAEKGNPSE